MPNTKVPQDVRLEIETAERAPEVNHDIRRSTHGGDVADLPVGISPADDAAGEG